MKEEEWREPLALNLLRGASRRLSISDIVDWRDQFNALPNGDRLGQFVFALNTSTATTCIGQCVTSSQLIPFGLCCIGVSSFSPACTTSASTTCGFCLCAGGTFVALGSVNGCGATLFRKIA